MNEDNGMQLIRRCAGLFLVLMFCRPSLLLAQSASQNPASEPRARDLGIPFDGTPGPFNAITDVNGVEVGYKTLISGEGKLVIGKGPVRTGVTAILPRGKSGKQGVFAGFFFGKWQRRHDGNALDRGKWRPRDADIDYEYE
jgi:D-aminopeptidase